MKFIGEANGLVDGPTRDDFTRIINFELEEILKNERTDIHNELEDIFFLTLELIEQ